MIVYALDGTVRYWNTGAETLYGWPSDSMVGRDIRALDVGRPAAGLARLRREGEWRGEVRRRDPRGRLVSALVRRQLRRDGSGAPRDVIEVGHGAEHAAADKSSAGPENGAELLGWILAGMPMAACCLDLGKAVRMIDAAHALGRGASAWAVSNPSLVEEASHRIVISAMNEEAAQLFAGQAPERLEYPIRLASAAPDLARDLLTAYVGGERLSGLQAKLVSVDGHERHVMAAASRSPIPGADASVVLSLHDIGDRVALEAQVARLQGELAGAARARSWEELSGAIAHELAQPLAAIATNADAALRWLRRPQPDLAEVEHAALVITRTVRRANGIVRQARAIACQREPDLAALDLAAVITDSLAILEHELATKRVAVRTDLASALVVRGDAGQLQQVVTNLIINAIQAIHVAGGHPGDRTDGVTIRARKRPDGRVEVEVRDTGPGISPENLPRIFERFFTTKAAGMGIGLAICRAIVLAHRGEIEAENQPGGGALFRIVMPAIGGGETV